MLCGRMALLVLAMVVLSAYAQTSSSVEGDTTLLVENKPTQDPVEPVNETKENKQTEPAPLDRSTSTTPTTQTEPPPVILPPTTESGGHVQSPQPQNRKRSLAGAPFKFVLPISYSVLESNPKQLASVLQKVVEDYFKNNPLSTEDMIKKINDGFKPVQA